MWSNHIQPQESRKNVLSRTWSHITQTSDFEMSVLTGIYQSVTEFCLLMETANVWLPAQGSLPVCRPAPPLSGLPCPSRLLLTWSPVNHSSMFVSLKWKSNAGISKALIISSNPSGIDSIPFSPPLSSQRVYGFPANSEWDSPLFCIYSQLQTINNNKKSNNNLIVLNFFSPPALNGDAQRWNQLRSTPFKMYHKVWNNCHNCVTKF